MGLSLFVRARGWKFSAEKNSTARSMGLTYLISLKKNRKRRHPLAGETKLLTINHGRANNSKYIIKETFSASAGREQSKASASGVCGRCESAGRQTYKYQGCCIIEQGFLLARARVAPYPLMIMGVRREKRDTIAEWGYKVWCRLPAGGVTSTLGQNRNTPCMREQVREVKRGRRVSPAAKQRHIQLI